MTFETIAGRIYDS